MSITRAADHHNVMAAIGKPKPMKKQKKQKNPPIDKTRIMADRSKEFPYVDCECGCGQHGHDLHHCLIHRIKGQPHFDDDRNLVLVNHWEHNSRMFDNQRWRKRFWSVQVKRYGLESMMEWVNNIPEKYKSRVDWL